MVKAESIKPSDLRSWRLTIDQHAPESYTSSFDKNGLQGARIGVLRESIGSASEPRSDDFKKVDAAFEKNIAELKAAGAILTDPIVIPRLKELLAQRAADRATTDEALQVWLARNPASPFKSREIFRNRRNLTRFFLPPEQNHGKRIVVNRTRLSTKNTLWRDSS